jgi:DNA repair protein RadC
LKEALGLVDVLIIDHIVVGSEGCESFAELGYL